MTRLLRRIAATAALALWLAAGAAQAQLPPASGIVINQTPVQGGSAGQCLFINNSQISSQACGGAGTVTSVSVTTANGISGTVATATTTPAISLTLGAITPSSVAIGAGSAITSSGPGGTLASGAYAAAAPCSAFGTAAGTCAQGGVITGAGPVGSATATPVITFNNAGQLTTVTSATVTPAIGSVTGLGTGVATALGTNVGSAGAPVVNGGALGTPSSGVATNLTGTAAGLTAGNTTSVGGTDQTTTWPTYVPTVTCTQTTGTAVCTGLAANFKTAGKTVYVNFAITVTGTFTAGLLTTVSLPVTAAALTYVLLCRESATTGLLWTASTNGANASMANYLNSQTVTSGNVFVCSGVYQST